MQRDPAGPAEGVPSRRLAAVGADDLLADLDLERLLEKPEMERSPQPQQRDCGEHQLDGDVDDRAGQERGERGDDEQRRRQGDRDGRATRDTQCCAVTDGRPIAEPERPDRGADRPGRHDRQRDGDGDDPRDPRERFADRRHAAGEEIRGTGDDLRPDEGDGRGHAERRPVHHVVVAPIAHQQEWPGHHHDRSRERHRRPRTGRCRGPDPRRSGRRWPRVPRSQRRRRSPTRHPRAS